jgi:hypothetical protein
MIFDNKIQNKKNHIHKITALSHNTLGKLRARFKTVNLEPAATTARFIQLVKQIKIYRNTILQLQMMAYFILSTHSWNFQKLNDHSLHVDKNSIKQFLPTLVLKQQLMSDRGK